MTEKDDKGSFERARQQILNDKSTSEQQKETLLKQLAKTVIPAETKTLDIKISNEIPQKTKDDIELATRTREMLRLKYTEHGLECPKLENLEDMDRASAILRMLKQRTENSSAPEGSAPLNEQQYGKSGNQKGSFESANAMIADLYARKDPEAKEILDQLWAKAYEGFKDKKYGEHEVTAPEDFLQNCVKKSDEYKKWLTENRRGSA